MHPRKLIRHAVVVLLTAADTAAGSRVKPTRVEPNRKGQLPALGVYTLNDPVDEEASSETEEAHEVELEIVGWVAHSDDLTADDAMDDLAEEVEAAMKAAPYLDGAAGSVRLVGTTMQVVEDDGRSDPLIGIVTLTYAVTYRVDQAAPANLDNLLRVDTKHRPVGTVDANQARDTFTVQETP
jgi:hypothetical protein